MRGIYVGLLIVGLALAVVALVRYLLARRRRARLLARLYPPPLPPVRSRIGWVGGDIRPISLDCTRGEDYYRAERNAYTRRLAQQDARERLAARGLRVDELEVTAIDPRR